MLEFERIEALLDRTDPLILEIGANNGEHTAGFLRTFPLCKIVSFEPDPRAIAKFKLNIRDPRARLIEKAVGQLSGSISFYQSSGRPPNAGDGDWKEGWDLSGSIRKPTGHLAANPWCEFKSIIDVDIITLDEWASLETFNQVDLIWADVQGAEIDLIEGGLATLAKTRYFYTEFSDTEMYEGEADLKQLMRMLPHFEIVEIFNNDVLLKNVSDFFLMV